MKELLDDVKAFIDRNKSVIDRNLDDLAESRGFSSGFGFSKKDRELRGEKGRAEITTNITRPWYNAVISSYTASPFVISAKSFQGGDPFGVNAILEYQIEKSDLADVAEKVLSDILNDGYGYFLVDTAYDSKDSDNQYCKPIHLDNGRTFMDSCESATGADCQMAVYVDLILKETAKEKYNIDDFSLRQNSDPFAEIGYYGKNEAEYTSIATVYRMTSEGCEISTMIHGVQYGESVVIQGLSRLPIIRAAAEKVWLESEEDWVYRGAYWFVYGLVKKINYEMSAQVEQAGTRPLAKFLAARGNFDGVSNQLADIHKNPRVALEYNVLDATGTPLPKPDPLVSNVLIDGLMDDVERTKALVNEILGTPSAEAPENETAEAVLLKKSTKEATVSRYLKALKEALEEVGKVMLDMLPVLYSVPRFVHGRELSAVSDASSYYIVIDKGPMDQTQKQRSISVLLAISSMIKENPNNPALPLIIQNTELSQDEKEQLIASLQGNGQLPPQVVQAMQQKDAQLAEMQAQLQQAGQTISALQIQLNEMINDAQTKYRIAVLESQTKLQIKQMELAADNQETQQKIMADFQITQQKAMADIEKEKIKALSKAPQTPVFDRGRFI